MWLDAYRHRCIYTTYVRFYDVCSDRLEVCVNVCCVAVVVKDNGRLSLGMLSMLYFCVRDVVYVVYVVFSASIVTSGTGGARVWACV